MTDQEKFVVFQKSVAWAIETLTKTLDAEPQQEKEKKKRERPEKEAEEAPVAEKPVEEKPKKTKKFPDDWKCAGQIWLDEPADCLKGKNSDVPSQIRIDGKGMFIVCKGCQKAKSTYMSKQKKEKE